ncbi:MAG: hypothetical protein ACQES4_06520 [Bacillota bacterium]
MFEKVVIATDFSPDAERAEQIVSELSNHAGKVILASVLVHPLLFNLKNNEVIISYEQPE